MKVAILAGGLGTRLQEETSVRPKPLVEVGGQPILWHIMKIYASYGFKEFVIGLGYKGDAIKDYFINYRYHSSNISIQLQTGKVTLQGDTLEDWTVHLLDTGCSTQTGGRVKRLAEFIGPETFMLTYGDGVADIDINKLLQLHKSHGRIATVTAVRPPARFGGIDFAGDFVQSFEEKPQIGEGWINGGFFVLEPSIVDYISSDETIFEKEPLEKLSWNKQLVGYRHFGFWQCMDTLRDVRLLEGLWQTKQPPWKIWGEKPETPAKNDDVIVVNPLRFLSSR